MERYEFHDLFSELPYAAAVSTKYLRSHCSNCFSSAKSACGKCSSVVYCGKQCQANDWPFHKAECGAFVKRRDESNASDKAEGKDEKIDPVKQEREKMDEEFVRVLGRLLLRKQKDKGLVCLSEGFPKFAKDRCLDDLLSHADELPQQRVTNDILAYFHRFFKGHALAKVSDSDLRITLGRIMINNFCIVGPPDAHGRLIGLGVGLYLNASRFDHTCERDAKLMVQSDGNRLRIQLVTSKVDDAGGTAALPQTEDEFNSLTFTYGFSACFWTAIPLIQQRRDCLRDHYFFECHCPRCDDQLDAILSWDASSRECPVCHEPYILDSVVLGRLYIVCRCSSDSDACNEQKRPLSNRNIRKAESNCQQKTARQMFMMEDVSANIENSWRVDEARRYECAKLEKEWLQTIDGCIVAQSPMDAIDIGGPFSSMACKYWHPVFNLRLVQLNERLLAAYRAVVLSHFVDHRLFTDPTTPMFHFRFQIPDTPQFADEPDSDKRVKSALRMALKLGELVCKAYKYHLPGYDSQLIGHYVYLAELFELASVLTPTCHIFTNTAEQYYAMAFEKWTERGGVGVEQRLDELQFRLERVVETKLMRSVQDERDNRVDGGKTVTGVNGTKEKTE